jgi:hypothetical protein
MRLPIEPEEAPSGAALYVASALSHLDDHDLKLIDAWSEVVRSASIEGARCADPPWEIRVHLPVVWSSPQRMPNADDEMIYRTNRRRVLEADVLVVLGHKGASLGAGQELEWAAGLGIPVLHVSYEGDPVSRQIRGAPADFSFEVFRSAEELADKVRDFMMRRRHAIEEQPRRRRNRVVIAQGEYERFRDAWARCRGDRRDVIAAEARLPLRRIDELLDDPLEFATARFNELTALSGALGFTGFASASSLHVVELTQHQESALAAAANEYGWPAVEALRLHRLARDELAAGGVRRLPLANIDDWVRLRDHFRDA